MTVEFDPQLERPKISGMRLKADGSELRVAVLLELVGGGTLEDVVFIKPSDLPPTAKTWIEGFCADAMRAKYGG